MQDRIEVNKSILDDVRNAFAKARGSLGECDLLIKMNKGNLDWKIPSRAKIDSLIKNISKKIDELEKYSENIENYVKIAGDKFSEVDKKQASKLGEDKGGEFKVGGGARREKKDINVKGPRKDIDTDKTHERAQRGSDERYKSDTNVRVGAKAEYNYSVKKEEAVAKSDWGEAKAGYGLGNFKAEGRAEWDPTEGKVILGAGVAASVLKAEASARAGNEYASVGVGAEGSVLSAEAAAEAAIDLKSGKVVVGAEAGAYLCEGTASASANVMGVEAKASATGYVGAGISGNVGLKDGKFSFSGGAALGIGGKVSFEVGIPDVGKAAKTAGKALSNAGKTASKLKFW